MIACGHNSQDFEKIDRIDTQIPPNTKINISSMLVCIAGDNDCLMLIQTKMNCLEKDKKSDV